MINKEMTIEEFLTGFMTRHDILVIEHQYMNWDTGEKNKVQLPIYGAEYKDSKLIIKCGEE